MPTDLQPVRYTATARFSAVQGLAGTLPIIGPIVAISSISYPGAAVGADWRVSEQA